MELNMDLFKFKARFNLQSSNGEDLLIKIDTGADFSSMSIYSAYALFPDYIKYIKAQYDLLKSDGINMHGVQGNPSKAIPFLMRNVKIEDYMIDKFYFHLYEPTKPGHRSFLLGMDFISCCGLNITADGKEAVLKLGELNKYVYWNIWRDLYKEKVIELNDVTHDVYGNSMLSAASKSDWKNKKWRNQ